MNPPPIDGYWFSDDTGRLPYGDGREYTVGTKLSVKGKLVICKNALHGSLDPFDALMKYAPGPILHKVRFEGARIVEGTKVGSRSRTILATRDATAILRKFACDQALRLKPLGMPAVVEQYLITQDEIIRRLAAASARVWAYVSARDDTQSLAGIARAAAYDSFKDNVIEAARVVALDVARAAATWNSWGITWEVLRADFNHRVNELFAEGEPP